MKVTIRKLSEACGVSTATVSRALAGHPHVRPEVRTRIEREAKRLGYRRNPLVGSLMGHVRTARTDRFVGNLALVHVPTRAEEPIVPQLKRIMESTRTRAGGLGFAAEMFQLGPGRREEQALARMLRARGVSGVLFYYSGPSAAPVSFPWDDFSAIALDFARREPVLNTICHDHYLTLKSALERMQAAGYRRIGLFIERFKDERTDFRWSAAFFSFQESSGGIGRIPLCSPRVMTQDVFLPWYQRHRPDLVVGHVDQAVHWLRQAGVGVPEETAFFNLNWEDRSFPCAGIDPRLERQGQVAAEVLIAHVQRGERGLPPEPRLTMVSGRLVAGPTVPGLALE